MSATRRQYLRAVGGALGVAWLSQAASADDIVEFESGSSDRCDRFVRYETRDGEEFESCIGPDGGYTEEIDEDGDERRVEFDGDGVVRRVIEEDEDGDEEERRFDANGTLRYQREVDDDGDEELRRFDANGTLRFRRKEDDDGDVREWTYDANGTLRLFERDDEDGDETRRVYDERGVLVEDDGDD